MAHVSCDVVRDLLPLYVDEALSDDSRKLVEEHLEQCPACTEHCRALRQDVAAPAGVAADTAALKRIRRGILTRRVRAALVSALCVAALAFGAHYALYVHETYIPYEESGLHVDGDALQTDAPFYASRGYYSPDGEALFLYLTTTFYTERAHNVGLVTAVSLDEQSRTMTIEDDESGTERALVCTRIYYVPEDCVGMLRGSDGPLTDDELEQLEEASVLVWSTE